MIKGYEIDGVNLLTTFNFQVGDGDGSRKSSDSVEKPNDNAPLDSFTWPASDGGIEYYNLDAPVYDEPKVIEIVGHLKASSYADYTDKKTGLIALVKSPGTKQIYSPDINQYVTGLFSSWHIWDRKATIQGNSNIITKIGMRFIEIVGESGYGPGIPDSNVYYGPSAAQPVTSADLLALSSAAVSPFALLNTGTAGTYFTIGLPGLTISEVYDQTNELYITEEYVFEGTASVSGQTISIYTMHTAVPYLNNAVHKISYS